MSDIYGAPIDITKTFLPGFLSYLGRHFLFPFILDFVYIVRTSQNIIIEGDCPPVYWVMFVYAFSNWMDIDSFKVREMSPSKIPDL